MKHFLDITRETCPMTFVKVKLRLAKMDAGEKLEVLLNAGEPLENVPRSCEEQGFKVLSNEPTDNGKHLLLIEK
ncbi:MAG: response regulator SirA [Zetaproteobacteria bacterium CG06_land_8_20_14_3_00_59_53]|nr:MAG: response regulator SirA [Zetaproteobacteria bacterium CG2_30_59_37]PIO90048.1 MAG: response regulator SirA [Zetaproteobacteria bacterium CG23_combo_of_CG06-09_8_20_14_all_59_86]PIQ64980.1 MAG: response regulator SirA [Zetaproteobacteria bacterium CG11_big_fil_rev_8_21_14_0_20_59_439]PIU69450.1 MAG: response regulator SirA [Zetaproteobacteria bacterium CG06_land_8_20_14_3_00_59_53]PIU96798.1 MAG: response regulator SirA [Zetaproteobacteria bacterium CG03_land_8_20_14_0_80_59_51]PIY46779